MIYKRLKLSPLPTMKTSPHIPSYFFECVTNEIKRFFLDFYMDFCNNVFGNFPQGQVLSISPLQNFFNELRDPYSATFCKDVFLRLEVSMRPEPRVGYGLSISYYLLAQHGTSLGLEKNNHINAYKIPSESYNGFYIRPKATYRNVRMAVTWNYGL